MTRVTLILSAYVFSRSASPSSSGDCPNPGVHIISDTAGNLRKGGSFAGWMSVVSLI